MLENTILKIGSLLQVGFGQAGSTIIGKNMSSGDGELNIMMPGSKIQAVFGCIYMQKIEEVTIALQNHTLIFINTVTSVIHECLCRWSGIPSQHSNGGNKLLVVWYLPEASKSNADTIGNKKSYLCDRALMSMVKILAEVARSPILQEYNHSPELMEAMDGHLHLSFGLHTGWAIEGPVGSDFKVDAIYLSPGVKITESLALSADSIYNERILMSEAFYRICSLRTKQCVRKIDVVFLHSRVSGLYSFPLRQGSLKQNPPPPEFPYASTNAGMGNPGLGNIASRKKAQGESGNAMMQIQQIQGQEGINGHGTGHGINGTSEQQQVNATGPGFAHDHTVTGPGHGHDLNHQQQNNNLQGSGSVTALDHHNHALDVQVNMGAAADTHGSGGGGNNHDHNIAQQSQSQAQAHGPQITPPPGGGQAVSGTAGGTATAAFQTQNSQKQSKRLHHLGDVIRPPGLEVDSDTVERDGVEFLFLIDRDVAHFKIPDLSGEFFYTVFRRAMCEWVVGNWVRCLELLNECHELDPEDGATRVMMEHIKGHELVPPRDWNGYKNWDMSGIDWVG